MKPSDTFVRLPGHGDEDHMSPSHDAISAWLLRAVRVPGFAERLLKMSRPGMAQHSRSFTHIELESLILDPTEDRVVGFADAMLTFSEGVRLWIEIKTDDNAIGALVRQVKFYKRFITGDKANWLALLPDASAGAQELLSHAGVGLYVVGAVPVELVSVASRGDADPFAGIPDAT